MIDTNEIRTLMSDDDYEIYDSMVYELLDEIDRLRGEQAKVTALEAIRDAAVGLFLTSQNVMIDGESCRVVDHGKLIAMSALILRENDHPRGEQQTPPQGKTIDVRVAVAVSSNSEWNAAGWHDGKHDVVVETAMDSAHFPATIFWLTATLPVPAEVEVVAKVEGE